MTVAAAVSAWVKRRETPAAAALYAAARALLHGSVVWPAPVARTVYDAVDALTWGARIAMQKLWYEPVFRGRLAACGPGLVLWGGMPFVYGPVELRVGARVVLNRNVSFVSSAHGSKPQLTIGDDTSLGFAVVVSCARAVTIGRGVRIAQGCFITDNPGHPLDAAARAAGLPAEPERVRPVTIEDDVWLGTNVMIMPGVTIGRGAVVGAGTVVTRDVPPGALVAGAAGRVIRAAAADVP